MRFRSHCTPRGTYPPKAIHIKQEHFQVVLPKRKQNSKQKPPRNLQVKSNWMVWTILIQISVLQCPSAIYHINTVWETTEKFRGAKQHLHTCSQAHRSYDGLESADFCCLGWMATVLTQITSMYFIVEPKLNG